MTANDSIWMQVDQLMDLSVFQGAAASLLLRAKVIHDNLPESYEEIWEHNGSHASWLEIPNLQSCFVCVRGPERDDLMIGFKALMGGSSVEDLIAGATNLPHDELLLRFYWVAYMTEHPNKAVLDFFDEGMKDERESIRLSVLNGYYIRRWPEWRAALERAATSDVSEKVRAQAKTILDKC